MSLGTFFLKGEKRGQEGNEDVSLRAYELSCPIFGIGV